MVPAALLSFIHAPERAQHVLVFIGILVGMGFFFEWRVGVLGLFLWLGLATGRPFARHMLRWIAELTLAVSLLLGLSLFLILVIPLAPDHEWEPFGLDSVVPFIAAPLAHCCANALRQNELWLWSSEPTSELRPF